MGEQFKAMIATAGKDKLLFAIENKLPIIVLPSGDVAEYTLCKIIEEDIH